MKRFTNILYFADGALDVGTGLERAVALAKTNAARLTVVDVLGETGKAWRRGPDLGRLLVERRTAELERMVARFFEETITIQTRVLSGKPFVEVIRTILRDGHDLLVKDARSMAGRPERLLGSSDQHILRKCPCPVWLDRPAAPLPYRTILAAVNPMEEDGAGCARLVMDLSTSLARRERAELAVVHAWRLQGESVLRSGRAGLRPDELESLLEETRREHATSLDALLEPYGLTSRAPEVHFLKGDPAVIIRELRDELRAELIVMGTLGRAGISGFFIGNTAEEVLQTTPASILAVKPRGFVSPVTLE